MASADRSGSCDGIVANGSVRLRRRWHDALPAVSPPLNRNPPANLGVRSLKDYETSKRGGTLDHSQFDTPHTFKFEYGRRGGTGKIESNLVLRVASDLKAELFDLLSQCRAGCGQGQAMTIGIMGCSLFYQRQSEVPCSCERYGD